MRTVSHEEIMKLKYADRETVEGLERHADGNCIHLGKISPGCETCFTGVLGGGIQIGQECMCNCAECYYDPNRSDRQEHPEKIKDVMADFFREGLNPNWMPRSYSYQSTGETLMYMDKLRAMGPVFKQIEDTRGINIYHHLYTNGLLLDDEMLEECKKLRINEFRFHVSASNFSDKVFRNMERVRDDGTITVSVEEPSMPHRRQAILDHLDTFQELNVKHLNLIEVQITKHNKPNLEKIYPGTEGRIYKEHFYHLYDEGLVYEVMRERNKRDHTYSVMDCNSTTESHRHGKFQHLGLNADTLEGMCAPFKFRR